MPGAVITPAARLGGLAVADIAGASTVPALYEAGRKATALLRDMEPEEQSAPLSEGEPQC